MWYRDYLRQYELAVAIRSYLSYRCLQNLLALWKIMECLNSKVIQAVVLVEELL